MAIAVTVECCASDVMQTYQIFGISQNLAVFIDKLLLLPLDVTQSPNFAHDLSVLAFLVMMKRSHIERTATNTHVTLRVIFKRKIMNFKVFFLLSRDSTFLLDAS